MSRVSRRLFVLGAGVAVGAKNVFDASPAAAVFGVKDADDANRCIA